MQIKITQETVFGTITKTFDNMVSALEWMKISMENDLPFTVTLA